MSRNISAALAMAILAGMSSNGFSADDPNPPTRPSYRPGTFYGNNDPKPEPKPVPKEKKESPAAPKVSPVDVAAQQSEKEMANYLRREQVCDRLALLAIQSGDAEQIRRVEELKERVFSVYKKRVSSFSNVQVTGNLEEDNSPTGLKDTNARPVTKGGAK